MRKEVGRWREIAPSSVGCGICATSGEWLVLDDASDIIDMVR
jgi:hypothetical protein